MYQYHLNFLECKGKTPILCPDNRCVIDIYYCDLAQKMDMILINHLIVEGIEIWVKSQIDYDCPKVYIRCDYMRYYVREDRPDMCALYIPKMCQRYENNRAYFPDVICRDKYSNPPSQIVCPIRFVLCPDLTCRETHEE